jgi:hypothetical protein
LPRSETPAAVPAAVKTVFTVSDWPAPVFGLAVPFTAAPQLEQKFALALISAPQF